MALEDAVTWPNFSRFLKPRSAVPSPELSCGKEPKEAISAQTQTVYLNDETLTTHKEGHPHLGEIVTKEGDKYLVSLKRGEKHYYAIVKTTQDLKEICLLPLRYINEEHTKSTSGGALKRGEVVYRK
ncbi:hypothetical protein G4V39_05800 [Thermosulfuriphilus ammonigenes]|uniref:Uncharacterized protein n=1 Tax=Thermosulfuriphilus ammonigenes TaxID=1936021 RepID=A0A6G7PVU2_9BACT|nr:hypothetical protein [Thermosulfuriphilus ammonigenes]MBA2848009.1 hypothetical protein [Thermosulfuriphilus ammonigenes]QIJ71804.1 hypothetical protein G4V39_05800 [Thermosulfuriphilus ammonigenes]